MAFPRRFQGNCLFFIINRNKVNSVIKNVVEPNERLQIDEFTRLKGYPLCLQAMRLPSYRFSKGLLV